MMEICRDFYLNKLIKRKNNGLIKVITGIRRCGKSYLLNNLFYQHLLERHCHRVCRSWRRGSYVSPELCRVYDHIQR